MKLTARLAPGKNRPSIPQQPTRNETSCNHEQFRAKLAGFGYLELIDGSFCFLFVMFKGSGEHTQHVPLAYPPCDGGQGLPTK